MIRVATAALLATLIVAFMAWPQRPAEVETRIRDLERWQAIHDRDVPKSSGVYVEQIQSNAARIADLERQRNEDIRWFFAGGGTILLATLAFFVKRLIEGRNGK